MIFQLYVLLQNYSSCICSLFVKFLNNSSNSIIILQFFIVAKGALEGIM